MKDRGATRTWTSKGSGTGPGPPPLEERTRGAIRMTPLATSLPTELDHHWELDLEEFEDGHSIRRFECVDCGAVRFE